MTLVGVAVFESKVRELAELPVVKLLKGFIELPDAPELVGRNPDILFKQPLEGAFCNMQFLLHFYQGVFRSIFYNDLGGEPDKLAVGRGFGDQAEHIIIQQGEHC